jgi:hypothetical protein
MMTREQWLERATGAYQQLSGCTDEEAEEWKKEWDGIDIDTENDCPVESATQNYVDECAEVEIVVADAGTGGSAG